MCSGEGDFCLKEDAGYLSKMWQAARPERVCPKNNNGESDKKKKDGNGTVDALLLVPFLGLPPCRLRCTGVLPAVPAKESANGSAPQPNGRKKRVEERNTRDNDKILSRVLPTEDNLFSEVDVSLQTPPSGGNCGGLPALRVQSAGGFALGATRRRCGPLGETNFSGTVVSIRNGGSSVGKQREQDASPDSVYTDLNVATTEKSSSGGVGSREAASASDKHKRFLKEIQFEMSGGNSKECFDVVHGVRSGVPPPYDPSRGSKERDTARELSFENMMHMSEKVMPLVVRRLPSVKSEDNVDEICGKGMSIDEDNNNNNNCEGSPCESKQSLPETAVCRGGDGSLPPLVQGSQRAVSTAPPPPPISVLFLHKWVRRVPFLREVNAKTTNTSGSTITTTSSHRAVTVGASVSLPPEEEEESDFVEQRGCELREYVPRATGWGVFPLKGL